MAGAATADAHQIGAGWSSASARRGVREDVARFARELDPQELRPWRGEGIREAAEAHNRRLDAAAGGSGAHGE